LYLGLTAVALGLEQVVLSLCLLGYVQSQYEVEVMSWQWYEFCII
jgi:hypothetical protein